MRTGVCGLASAVALMLGAAPTWAQEPTPPDVREMQRRGDPPGEIQLALAAFAVRARNESEAVLHLGEARKQGISAGRLDLLLATLRRSLGRYDEAFELLTGVLVRHEEQPYALVQLWKTLYECKLRGAAVKTDTDAVRERLAASGLYFPRQLKLAADAAAQGKRLTAAAYNALLSGKVQFAAELFQAAIDAFPSDPQAHRGLGIARARRQEFLRAAGAYLLYLELSPMAPDADEVDKMLMEYWKTRCKGC